MTAETWSITVSFVAMLFIAVSYFVKSKGGYLLFQAFGMLFLMASYLLCGEYFAMIGLGVGLLRALVFFAYEKRNKTAPLVWAFVFAGMTVGVYLTVNICILQKTDIRDAVYLVSLVLYAFVFRIRDVETMRYAVTIPTSLAVLYNVLCRATTFVILSYTFELGANILSILKNHVFTKTKEVQGERI